MTTSAWIMLAVTWSVIALFTVSLFVRVLRKPPLDDTGTDASRR